MVEKHYFEIKRPDLCPNRIMMGPMYSDVGVCKQKKWTCLSDDKFPPWCPLKKLIE